MPPPESAVLLLIIKLVKLTDVTSDVNTAPPRLSPLLLLNSELLILSIDPSSKL